MTRALRAIHRTTGSAAQGLEARAKFFREDLRLLPRSEVTTPLDPVVVNQLRERLLRPTPRRREELVREDGHGNGNVDALGVEEPELVLPVQATRGDARVRQPGERDVVEEVVATDATGLSSEGAGDQLVAACIVVQQVAGQADGRVSDSVQGLR